MHYQISENLYLNRTSVPKQKNTVAAPSAVNHIIVIDCSGSMRYELPQIRQQLKNKLVRLVGPQDTVSIIWFSGKGQFGTLIEGEPIATLGDLQSIHKTIDRWLQPIGLTGFKEPLDEIVAVKERVAKATGNDIFSVWFMSDGHDNQWNTLQVLHSAGKINASAATVVEYGMYADRNMLSEMATAMGGSYVFSRDFDNYAVAFESAMTKRVSGTPRVCIYLKDDDDCTIDHLAFSIINGDIVSFSIDLDGSVMVPPESGYVYWLADEPDGVAFKTIDPGPLYAAVSLFATRMRPEIVYPILKELGDVRFVQEFSKCFGKDRYAAFQQMAAKAAVDPSERLVDGYNSNALPRDDAFTVLELLEILNEEDRLLLDRPEFQYNRISRQREVGKVSEKEIDDACSLIANADPASLRSAVDAINAIISKVESPELKFTADPAPSGYAVGGIVVSEERANISVRIQKRGTVDLSGVEGLSAYVPVEFPTFVYRNYAIVKDGMVNVPTLPVRLSYETFKKIRESVGEGRLDENAWEYVIVDGPGDFVLFHLDKLPVINRNMVKAPSASEVIEMEWQLLKLQAKKKVYDHFKKELYPRKSAGFIAQFGADNEARLKELGITEYNGFNPGGTQAESVDFYLAKELKVKAKGFSSLPSVADVKKRIESGKMTPAAALMAEHVKFVEYAIDNGIVTEEWFSGVVNQIVAEVRKLQFALAKIKFAVLVGQVWFREFATLDENTITLSDGGQDVEFTFETREVEVKI